jgi:hypothetical protein
MGMEAADPREGGPLKDIRGFIDSLCMADRTWPKARLTRIA